MSAPELRLTLLGTGSSGGVPRIGNEWGACDPSEPRNRRMRCSALVEQVGADGGVTSVLIDTAPDLRVQALAAGITRLDGVIFTHDHADQANGIDDLRVIAGLMRARVKVWADAATRASLTQRFAYCFEGSGGYPPILDLQGSVEPGSSFSVDGPGGRLDVQSFDLDHGLIRSLGFRFGPIAYCNDMVDLPDAAKEVVRGAPVAVWDALRYTPHPTHAHVDKVLGWIAELGTRENVLTNLHVDLDYRMLESELPAHVRPAYDGLMITADAAGERIGFDERPGWALV